MNRYVTLSVLTVCMFSWHGVAEAAIIAGSASVSGPGGTGVAVDDPTTDTVLEVEKTFNSNDYLDVSFEVDSSGFYSLDELVGNATGTTWTGFQFDLVSAPADTAFILALDASTSFAAADPLNGPPTTSFQFTGGTVTSGNAFSLIVALAIQSAGEITIRQTPLAASTSPNVPEPATGILFALGAAALALHRRPNR